jgi:hypothetical protein
MTNLKGIRDRRINSPLKLGRLADALQSEA